MEVQAKIFRELRKSENEFMSETSIDGKLFGALKEMDNRNVASFADVSVDLAELDAEII